MRRKIGKAIMILLISIAFGSCEKEKESNNFFFIMNGKKVEIETANLTYFGNIANELDIFYIQVYSKGVIVFKDKFLRDSVIYPKNTIKLEFYLYKPHDLRGYSGTYVTNYESYPPAYSIRQNVYFNSSTNIWGLYEYADSAKVILKELDGRYDLYFEFIKHGTDKSPESIDIKGNYIGLN